MSETPARVITWDDIRAMYDKLLREVMFPRTVRIVGRPFWDATLARANDQQRALLLAAEKCGDIVISEHVPHGTIYEFTETEYERRLRGE